MTVPLITLSDSAWSALSRLRIAFGQVDKLRPHSTAQVIFGSDAKGLDPGMRGARGALDDLVRHAFVLMEALPQPESEPDWPYDPLTPAELWLLRQVKIGRVGWAEHLKLNSVGELMIAKRLADKQLGRWMLANGDHWFIINGAGLLAIQSAGRTTNAST